MILWNCLDAGQLMQVRASARPITQFSFSDEGVKCKVWHVVSPISEFCSGHVGFPHRAVAQTAGHREASQNLSKDEIPGRPDATIAGQQAAFFRFLSRETFASSRSGRCVRMSGKNRNSRHQALD